MKISKRHVIKFFKILFSRIGSMVIFSFITSIIIFKLAVNETIDELTNNINMGRKGNFSSNLLDDNSLLSPVITPHIQKNSFISTKQIPFGVEREYSLYLDEGETMVYDGVPGQIITEYEQVLVNGKIIDTNKLSNRLIRPKAKKILIGIRRPRPLSSFNGVELDKKGCPLRYEQYLPNRVATAYTAGLGARTSTNKIPKVGYVAVNPKVIPYHSVLYLKSKNNNFSGIFIAEDTGSAMRKGQADIDIFMTTEGQCFNFGRQKVDVYVLSKYK